MIVRYSCGCTALHLHQPAEGTEGKVTTTLVYCIHSCDAECIDPAVSLWERGSLLASARRGDKTWEPVTTEEARGIVRDLSRAVSDGHRGREVALLLSRLMPPA